VLAIVRRRRLWLLCRERPQIKVFVFFCVDTKNVSLTRLFVASPGELGEVGQNQVLQDERFSTSLSRVFQNLISFICKIL
jgi:hypothetical protein